MRALDHNLTIVKRCHRLPFQQASFLEPLGRMLADNVFLIADKFSNEVEQSWHQETPRAERPNSAAKPAFCGLRRLD